MTEKKTERNTGIELMSIREMQERLGIGSTKAYELVASGELSAVRIGRSIRINKRDLEEWLEQQSYTAARE